MGLWSDGALYFVPEVISLEPLSGLRGLGGAIQNAELQKSGGVAPTFYRSRLFVRQTWNLVGEPVVLESAPMQLAQTVASRRVVRTAGNLSILDVFGRKRFAGDLRQQFVNMAFPTHAAYAFAADARGYTWGLALEWTHDDWTLRAGRFIGPTDPNRYADGRTEVYSYLSADRSLSLGGILQGVRWGRPQDTLGIAYGASWISGDHAADLALGGIDGFIGDGALSKWSRSSIVASWRTRSGRRSICSAPAIRPATPTAGP